MTTTPDTGRRDRIVAALTDHLARTADIRPARDGQQAFMPEITDAELHRIADAVIAADQGHAAEVRAAGLDDHERQFLTFALDLAADRVLSEDGFTDEDDAALASLRRMAAAARPDNTTGA